MTVPRGTTHYERMYRVLWRTNPRLARWWERTVWPAAMRAEDA